MPLVGQPFLDKLLLGIIDAHMPKALSKARQRTEREKRLHAAKCALFGVEKRVKRFNDERALLSMAKGYISDRWGNARDGSLLIDKSERRSVRTLAEEAAPLAYGSSTSSTAQRLRTAFRGERMRRYLDLVRYSDDVEETIEHQVLEDIRAQLARYKIEMDLTRSSLPVSGSKKMVKSRDLPRQ